jgi:hypothetical protein
MVLLCNGHYRIGKRDGGSQCYNEKFHWWFSRWVTPRINPTRRVLFHRLEDADSGAPKLGRTDVSGFGH